MAIKLQEIRAARYAEICKRLESIADLSSERLDNLTMRLAHDEADRQLAYYPRSSRFLMPTRLGSVLRRYEVDVGSEYGLSTVTYIGHLAAVASPKQVEYLNDQRVALDFAVRCCLIGLLGSAVAVVLLWQHGIWLLVALGPYLLGYLAYRGSVVVAHEYGRALGSLVDLNRFELYERLRLVLPKTTAEERNLVATLNSLTEQHSMVESLKYVHPESSRGESAPEQEPPPGD